MLCFGIFVDYTFHLIIVLRISINLLCYQLSFATRARYIAPRARRAAAPELPSVILFLEERPLWLVLLISHKSYIV
jgi:hypothetical protein